MKLLTQNTFYFFVFSILVMIIAGLIFFLTIRSIVYKQIDNSLITEKTIIQDQIEDTDTIPDFTATFGHLIVVKLFKSPIDIYQNINDTSIYDAQTDTYQSLRHIRCSANTPRKTGYTIDIYQVLDENQQLLDSIALGMIFLFIMLLLVSIAINYFISKRIMSPFFSAVNEASNFNILSDKPLNLKETSIDEFHKLNEIILRMTNKMRTDYVNLKEYNENFSHEIQTPLAIIRSKLDILVQDESLNNENIDIIRSVNEATTRLFKLNQGLLLISKIENMQFPDNKIVSFEGILRSTLNNYSEILSLKNIKVETDILDHGNVTMNESLAGILISNLLSNAVRYNVTSGFIKCSLHSGVLSISNSGEPLDIDPELLFFRFRKGAKHPQSVGLGLSIVKKIVDYYEMSIEYRYSDNTHTITLNFHS
jgi:signal transduction histidine kinase